MTYFIRLSAIFAFAIPAFAQPTPSATLTVRGSATAADEKAATSAALSDALKNALEVVLEAPARTKHKDAIAEKVLPKASEILKSHEVLKSEKLASGKVSVQLRATIERATITAKLIEVGIISKEDLAANEIAEKVLTFCKEQLGKKVGDGECGTLAVHAIAAAKGKPFHEFKENPGAQDFVWGELQFVQEIRDGKRVRNPADAKPKAGDVIQYRDAVFRSSRGILLLAHHTAIVGEVKTTGELVVYEQNMGGKQEVTKGTLRPNELSGGWMRVYRPLAGK